MNQVVRRRCGNCCSFNSLAGIACTNDLIAATAGDCCDEHYTDLEAQHAMYERAAGPQSSIATLIGVGG